MSQRQDILEAVKARLAGISLITGYQTDAGQLIFLGEAPVLGPDDPDAAIAIVVGSDEIKYQGENAHVTLPIDVQAIAKVADHNAPWETVEAIISDIKTSMEVDHNLGGLVIARGLTRGPTRPLEREAGSTTAGAGIEYRFEFSEGWGTP